MFPIVTAAIFVLFKCLSIYFEFCWCGLGDLSLEIDFIFLIVTKIIFFFKLASFKFLLFKIYVDIYVIDFWNLFLWSFDT